MINPQNPQNPLGCWLVNGKSCQVVLTGTVELQNIKIPKWSFASRWEGIVLMGNNKDLKVGHKKGLIVRGSDLLRFILWWERNFLLFSAGHLFHVRTICNLSQEIGALQNVDSRSRSTINFPSTEYWHYHFPDDNWK